MGNFNLSEVGKDLIINIINIILLFVIVKLLVYKPVKKFLDDRKSRVAALTDDAERMKQEAQKTLEEHDSIIADAQKKAEEEGAAIRKNAVQDAEKIVSDARSEAEKLLSDARVDIESEKKQAMVDTKEQFSALAIQMTEKILDREVNDDDNKKAVESFLDELKG